MIILTLQDLPDGTVDVKMNLEPPVPSEDPSQLTMAQKLAANALNAIHSTIQEAPARRLVLVGADEMPH